MLVIINKIFLCYIDVSELKQGIKILKREATKLGGDLGQDNQ